MQGLNRRKALGNISIDHPVSPLFIPSFSDDLSYMSSMSESILLQIVSLGTYQFLPVTDTDKVKAFSFHSAISTTPC
jgi:hypothetical protein